jgi:hypothetical protein
MKYAVFWDIKAQFITHRRHITSPLQSPASYFYVIFEVFTAVTMKNAAFFDIRTQVVPHRRHITSPLQNPASYSYESFEVITAVTMKTAVFWDIKTQSVTHRRYNVIFLHPVARSITQSVFRLVYLSGSAEPDRYTRQNNKTDKYGK